MVGLFSPSGSGKTTFLQIAGLLDSNFSGDIYISGSKVDAKNDPQTSIIRRKNIGFVFQFFYDPNGGLLSPIYEILDWNDGIIGDKDKATYGIVVAAWYRQIGYCLIIYLAGLTAVNQEQIEAARMDGASGWKLFRYIVLPQLWPATFVAFVVTIIGALRTDSFDMTQIMTEGGPGRGASDVMSRYMFQKTLFDQDYGYGSAISVLLFMFMLIFIITFIIRMYYQDENLR